MVAVLHVTQCDFMSVHMYAAPNHMHRMHSSVAFANVPSSLLMTPHPQAAHLENKYLLPLPEPTLLSFS